MLAHNVEGRSKQREDATFRFSQLSVNMVSEVITFTKHQQNITSPKHHKPEMVSNTSDPYM